MSDILPSQTVYVQNLPEKIKKDGSPPSFCAAGCPGAVHDYA